MAAFVSPPALLLFVGLASSPPSPRCLLIDDWHPGAFHASTFNILASSAVICIDIHFELAIAPPARLFGRSHATEFKEPRDLPAPAACACACNMRMSRDRHFMRAVQLQPLSVLPAHARDRKFNSHSILQIIS